MQYTFLSLALHVALSTAQEADCVPTDLYPLLYNGDSFTDACAAHSSRNIVNWVDGQQGKYPEIQTCNCYPISGMDSDGSSFFQFNSVVVRGNSLRGWSTITLSGPSPIPGDRALYKDHDPKSFSLQFNMNEEIHVFGLTFYLFRFAADSFQLKVEVPGAYVKPFQGFFTRETKSHRFNVDGNAVPLSVGGLWMVQQTNMAMAVYTQSCQEAGSDHLLWGSGGDFVPADPNAEPPLVIRQLLALEVCYKDPLPGMTVPSSWRDGAFMLARSTQQRQTFRASVSEDDEGGVSTGLVAGLVAAALLIACCCLSLTMLLLILRRRRNEGSAKGRARPAASAASHSSRSNSSRYHAASRQASRSRVAAGA